MLFIFRSSMTDEDVEQILARIGEEVTRVGGVVTETIAMGDRSFARPMKKKESGRYVKMIANLDPAQVSNLQGRFRLLEDIFRSQVVNHVVPPPSQPVRPDRELAIDGE